MPLPSFGFHGTKIPAALQIIHETVIQPSTSGKCGAGVYTMECPDPIEPELLAAVWRRNAAYNCGAGLIVQVDGILIRGKSGTAPVPAGATAWDGDKQFCHSPASIGLYACVFAEAGLMEVVDAQLRSSGYTKELHEALLKVGTLVQSHVCTYKRRRQCIVCFSSLTSARSEGCRQYMIMHTQYSRV